MRLSPEEKKELDDWVEKEYPISMKRLEFSNPFHEKGKLFILFGIILYIIYVFSEINFLIFPLAILSIISGFFGKFIGDRNSEIITVSQKYYYHNYIS